MVECGSEGFWWVFSVRLMLRFVREVGSMGGLIRW